MKNQIITIFGGSGFLGSHIVQDLARAGFRIKIVTRIPESAYELKTQGNVGQIVACTCDYGDDKAIEEIVSGSYAVINLIGILYEKRKSKFKKAHVSIPEKIAASCKKKEVSKFIHVSALGVERGISKYAKSKLSGEEAVKKAFPNATILRPSVIFGPEDSFFNMFAKLSTFIPVLPLIGGGQTKFQPVYVGDIAEAVQNIILEKTKAHAGNTYLLGGPEVVTLKEIFQRLMQETNRKCALVHIPWFVAKIQAFFLGLMPRPLLTIDQVKSLKINNIVKDRALKLEDLGVTPTPMAAVLPRYLSCYRKGGRFADKKNA